MIHEIWLVCENDNQPEPVTEPPERMLKIEVVAGAALMSVHKVDWRSNVPDQKAEVPLFSVSVGSLVRALQVFTLDEAAGLPEAWRSGRECPACGHPPPDLRARRPPEDEPEDQPDQPDEGVPGGQ